MEQSQEELNEYDSIVAELSRSKAAGEAPALPAGIVLDEAFPGGFYKKRPCLEEFVAARYPAESYDTFFTSAAEDMNGNPCIPWGPGWSNTGWVNQEKLGELPAVLHVRSQVRRQATRTQRATAPTRHRFKQYLFGDPSHRLIRNRNLSVQTSRALAGIDELIEKERLGLLTVHLPNGARVDLIALKAAELKVYGLPLPAPQPNPPLDSIANDDPAGNPMPQYIEGSFPGDPAAERALENMLKDKQNELSDDETDPLDGADASDEESTGVESSPAETPGVDNPAATLPASDVLESDPLDGEPVPDVSATDMAAVEIEQPTETTEVSETPVPDTVPDVSVTTSAPPVSKGKKGNRR